MKNTFLILFWGIAFCSCSKASEIMQTEEVQMVDLSTNTKTMNSIEEESNVQRQIIKEGDIRFETADLETTRAAILKSVSDANGYISEDNVSDYEYSGKNKNRTHYEMTIRVPGKAFESLLEKVSQNAQKIDYKNIRALDVTEEFIDIEARIQTKKELENKYKELLTRAKTVEEILKIEKEIGTLRSDIESIEGRLKYLKDRVSYSKLTVVFYEKTSGAFGFNSKFTQALRDGWSNILWFFIVLANLWAFLLLGIIVIVVVKWLKKKNKSKKLSIK